MAFQQQRNVLAGLGQGIEKALQSAAGFFSKKAEQQYTQGVGAIAWAENEAAAIREAMANENVVISPEQRASFNQNLAYFDAVMAATPQEALKLREQGPPGGVAIKDVTRNLQRQANAFSSAQNIETGLPTDQESAKAREVPTETTRTVTSVPFAEMLAGVQRQAALGLRSYNESQVEKEREFVVGRDLSGQEHEIRLAELNNLAALNRQLQDAKDMEARTRLQGEIDAELRSLASRLSISENALLDAYGQNRARLEASLAEDAAKADATRAMQFASLESALATADARWAVVNDVTQSDAVRRAAASTLSAIVESGQLGAAGDQYSPEILQSALAQRDVRAREAELARLQAIINDSARSGVEVDEARERVSLLQEQVKLAGQTYRVNESLLTGEEQRQAIEAFNFSVSKTTSARDFIQGAIDLGLPEQLIRLREEVAAQKLGGSVHDDLAHMTAGLDMRSINSAIDLAEQSRTAGNRQHEYAIAEIDSKVRDLKLGDIAGRMQLIGVVGQSGMSEEDIRNDEGIQAMLEAGTITQGDVNAMVGRSALRTVLESETVNGPKIVRALDRLDTEYTQKRPSTPEEYAIAEQGLRSTLAEMVKLGALGEGDVEGLVALYTRAWTNDNDAFAADLALNRAQTAAYNAQSREASARATQLTQPKPPPPPDFDAIKWTYEQRFEILGNLYPGCSQVPTASEAEGQMMTGGGSNCDEYRAEMATARAEMDAAMGTYYGIDPSSPTKARMDLIANIDAVRTDFGDAAAEAFSLSFAATQSGLPVTPFVVGVDDPEEWMQTWGHSEGELMFNISPEGTQAREQAERDIAIEQAMEHPSWDDLVAWRNSPRSTIAGGAPLIGIGGGPVTPMPNGLSEQQWASSLGLTIPELREALSRSAAQKNQGIDPNSFTTPTSNLDAPQQGAAGPPPAGVRPQVEAINSALVTIDGMFQGYDPSAFGAVMSSPNNNMSNRTEVNALLADLRRQFPGLGIPNRTMLPGEARTELQRIRNLLLGQ